ncbi:MAG: TIGR02757 family protein [Thermoplasmata archaeon]|nr:TIGR02757 family protein [Thermoplasmata archaeon]MCI4359559.1 TIGR02757 family protein [Thermoplasmata archaeon]
MPRPHRPTPEFPGHLRALYERFPLERSLSNDPLSCVRRYARSRRSAEIAGLVAATLAIGNTTSIRRAFTSLADRVDRDLVAWVEADPKVDPDERLTGFKHRWVRGDQMSFLAARLHTLYRAHDSLEEVYRAGRDAESGPFAGGLDALAHALRGPDPLAGDAPPGYDRLFPSPLGPSSSPCKRLTLYVRWMVRREYPDLGLWTGVDPQELRIPLDQHVYWIAYHLGLTHRKTRTWETVEQVTAALRKVDALDPVKYDFVLCHTGISGDCPKRRDLAVCGPCAVRPDCLLWRGVGRAS